MYAAWLTDTLTTDLDRALHYTLLWGLERVELRTVGSASSRVPFVNEEKLRRRLQESDVAVAAIVPGLFEGAANEKVVWLNEVAQLEETLRFAKRIGCPRVVVSSLIPEGPEAFDQAVDALRRAGQVATRHGITLAVLNEADMTAPTGATLAGLLEAVAHPQVGAAWDPVAALQAGEDPLTGLKKLAGRVSLVRCANVMNHGEGWEGAALDEGLIDWKAQIRELAHQGFDGPVSLAINKQPGPRHGVRMASTLIGWLRKSRPAGS